MIPACIVGTQFDYCCRQIKPVECFYYMQNYFRIIENHMACKKKSCPITPYSEINGEQPLEISGDLISIS